MYSIIQQLANEGYLFDECIIELMETLLTIEEKQPMKNDDWVAFKNSATKRGLKILEKLRELGLYQLKTN
jgi:hypothetical protein